MSGKLESMGRPNLFLLVLFALATSVLAVSGPAAAATPCWKQVLNDWTRDQVIDKKYPSRCIDEAIERAPEDIRAYTDFVDQAEASRQGVTRDLYGAGGGGGPVNPTGTPSEREPRVNSKDENPVSWVLGAPGNDADSVPVPLLVLLGLAAALITAGGAGFAAKKIRARRPV